MLRIVSLLMLLSPPVWALEGEWRASALGALELPGLDSQSPTDFDLATFATGAQITYGLCDWLDLGGRFVYSQVEGVIDDYTARSDGESGFVGDLFVDLQAWRTEAVIAIRPVGGLLLEPRLVLAGGYTWTVYSDALLRLDDGDVPVQDSEEFAEGTLTATATVELGWRVLPFLEISVGAEATRYFDGLYDSAIRFPISISGVFWGPI